MSWLDDIPSPGPALRAKRIFDVVAAGTTIALGWPVIVGIGIANLRCHGWPPWFIQERPGHRGRPFRIVKWRTMTDARGPDGALLPDAERLTGFGEWLRKTSLDELPELWNVLRGEMSLVGPRPLLMRYLDRYSEEQARRHDMPPGLTGLAQVRGRNAISWADRLRLDVEYVDQWSLILDGKILLETIAVVISGAGVSAEGEATMHEFLGTAPQPVEASPDLNGGGAGR